jgi:hypothetical protein
MREGRREERAERFRAEENPMQRRFRTEESATEEPRAAEGRGLQLSIFWKRDREMGRGYRSSQKFKISFRNGLKLKTVSKHCIVRNCFLVKNHF